MKIKPLQTAVLVLSLVVLSLGGYLLYQKAISPHPQVAGVSSPSLPGKFDDDSFFDVLEAGAVVNPTYQDIQSDVNISGIVQLNQNTAPSPTTDKLYNVAGDLFWNGIKLNSGGYWTLSGNNLYPTTIGNNVGIGTAGPGAKLHVSGGSSSSDRPLKLQSTSQYEVAELIGPLWTSLLLTNSGGTTSFISNSGSGLAFGADSTTWSTTDLFIANAGNVGIGTASPANKLDVNGDVALSGKHAFRSSDSWLRLNQDGAFTSGVHTPGVFAPGSLNVGGAGGWGNPGFGNAWFVGNVGIGTTNPSQKLDVAGYVKGQSGLCMNNDCRASWPSGGDGTLSAIKTWNWYAAGTAWGDGNDSYHELAGWTFTAPVAGVVEANGQWGLQDDDDSHIAMRLAVDSQYGPEGVSDNPASFRGGISQQFLVGAGSHRFALQWRSNGGCCNYYRGVSVSAKFLPSQARN
ncbi:MAG: hypothetical protein Q7S44_02350 [bacterium]|nr:hypothetical protein [bacterium]